jgi:hypothetical protein
MSFFLRFALGDVRFDLPTYKKHTWCSEGQKAGCSG